MNQHPDKSVNFHGLSPRALSIARAVDRLEPGTYRIELSRPVSKTERWVVTITRTSPILTMDLEQKHEEPQAKDDQ